MHLFFSSISKFYPVLLYFMSDYMICILAKTGTTLIGRLTAQVKKINLNVANVMPEKEIDIVCAALDFVNLFI